MRKDLNEKTPSPLVSAIPLEIYNEILNYCDFPSMVALRAVSRWQKAIIDLHPSFLESLRSRYTQTATCGQYKLRLSTTGAVYSSETPFLNPDRPDYFHEVTNLKANVRQIWATDCYGIALTCFGEIWLWGHDFLGLDLEQNPPLLDTPKKIALQNIESVFVGLEFKMALAQDDVGHVWGWGPPAYMQRLGLKSKHPEPQLIAGLQNIKSVVFARPCFLALKEDGTVWIMGDFFSWNAKKATGLRRIKELNNIRQIYIHPEGSYGYALTTQGKVMAFGNNAAGELGLGNPVDKFFDPTLIKELSDIEEIAIGSMYTIARDKSGQVFIWGALNTTDIWDGVGIKKLNYQVQPMPTLTNIKAIINSRYVLAKDDSVYELERYDHTDHGLTTSVTVYVREVTLKPTKDDALKCLSARRRQESNIALEAIAPTVASRLTIDDVTRTILLKQLKDFLQPPSMLSFFGGKRQGGQANLAIALLEYITYKSSFTAIFNEISTHIELNSKKCSPDQESYAATLKVLLKKMIRFRDCQTLEVLNQPPAHG
jgi:hypothetical protein